MADDDDKLDARDRAGLDEQVDVVSAAGMSDTGDETALWAERRAAALLVQFNRECCEQVGGDVPMVNSTLLVLKAAIQDLHCLHCRMTTQLVELIFIAMHSDGDVFLQSQRHIAEVMVRLCALEEMAAAGGHTTGSC